MDKITLKNMKFFGYHGVLPREQQEGQDFFIDLELAVDLKKAGNSDNLEDTTDYAEIYALVKNITENNKFRLIEKLAEEISREILSRYEKITGITVRVRKPQAPIAGEFDWMGVEIERAKDGT